MSESLADFTLDCVHPEIRGQQFKSPPGQKEIS